MKVYRSVFDTFDGRLVLTDMLNEAKFFGEIDKDELEVHNFMKRVLAKIGLNHYQSQWEGMVDAMMDQPLPEQPEVINEDFPIS